MEFVIFLIAGALALIGAVGVIAMRNPVHSALSLVMTLFAVAVLFLNQDAQFLAAVQIIVYAGAIVVLFLFVIMLLGVDEAEDLDTEPIVGQRPVAVVIALAVLGLAMIPLFSTGGATGEESLTAPKLDSIIDNADTWTPAESADDRVDGVEQNSNTRQLGRTIFTDYVFAFEITALLLTIAVVGAVVLARRSRGELQEIPEPESLIAEKVPAAADGDDAPQEEGSA